MTDPTLLGTYSLDLEASAKLAAGFFHERFTMKPGYDQALAAYMKQNAPLANVLRITLSPDSLQITSADGTDTLPIHACTRSPEGHAARITWKDVAPSPFTILILPLAPGLIRLQNTTTDLDTFAFKRIAD